MPDQKKKTLVADGVTSPGIKHHVLFRVFKFDDGTGVLETWPACSADDPPDESPECSFPLQSDQIYDADGKPDFARYIEKLTMELGSEEIKEWYRNAVSGEAIPAQSDNTATIDNVTEME